MAARPRLFPRLPGVVWLLGVAVLGGCSDGASDEAAVDVAESVTVTSPVLRDGTPVPGRFTCDGANVSPALRWSGTPEDAQAWALVVDDPDAPGGVFVHWIVLDIPLEVSTVRTREVPSGSVQAENSSGDPSYTGPCPPEGTHHYRFTVYALNAPTGLEDGARREEALAAIDKHAIARGSGPTGAPARNVALAPHPLWAGCRPQAAPWPAGPQLPKSSWEWHRDRPSVRAVIRELRRRLHGCEQQGAGTTRSGGVGVRDAGGAGRDGAGRGGAGRGRGGADR